MGRHARPTRGGILLSMRSRKQTTVATASHGELPRLPSREGIKKHKLKEKKTERDKTLGYLGVVKPVTPGEGVPLRGHLERFDNSVNKGEKPIHPSVLPKTQTTL
ncbi:hypothetical protein AVEN_199469-1 [Araneus ventricosus]|uniref:Uncharacterized protein n=1 Tax=Araneus ventricosus TaxID=182803 RepID=A0A4Y2LCJ7_ARAVE|nr:hypothetical protein AVEN_199469-1 [Araneus ventricosus]